jgi:hypothetical protein
MGHDTLGVSLGDLKDVLQGMLSRVSSKEYSNGVLQKFSSGCPPGVSSKM